MSRFFFHLVQKFVDGKDFTFRIKQAKKSLSDYEYLIINNQRDAALSSLVYYSLRDYCTCFGCCLHPSSGVQKTVDAVTGTSHAVHYECIVQTSVLSHE